MYIEGSIFCRHMQVPSKNLRSTVICDRKYYVGAASKPKHALPPGSQARDRGVLGATSGPE